MSTLPRACQHPGCRSVALRGSHSCAAHQRHRSEPARPRESAARRGYDARWRRIRAMYLRHHPICVECRDVATEVDHITPIARGGTHAWDNLQPMCKPCHSRKTMSEYRGEGGRVTPRQAPREGLRR